MMGLPLSTFVEPFTRVADEFDRKPALSFDLDERIGDKVCRYLATWGKNRTVLGMAHELDNQMFARLTPDEKLKVQFSADYMMDSSFRRVMEDIPRYAILHKIKSSQWRCGLEKSGWNEVIDAYEAIRSFDLGIDGFNVNLDWTKWTHPCATSQFAQVWLDGVFGYLIHYRGEHVMTVSFSIAHNRRVLIQQVQNVNRRGNRWLFRLPADRLQFIVDRFRATFAGFAIHVIDGGDLAKRSLGQYREGADFVRKTIQRYSADTSGWYSDTDLAKAEENARSIRQSIKHLCADRQRQIDFYAGVARGPATTIQGMRHYLVA